jgi:hypothetical protein
VISVRLATLSDTFAIVGLHRAQWVPVPDLPSYDDLTLYERWQEGGVHLSVETCAVHINRLLAGVGTPLVAERNDQVVGYAEVYESFEPVPFGHHLHIGKLTTVDLAAAAESLIRYLADMGRMMKCERVTAALKNDSDPAYYDFQPLRKAFEVKIAAQEGRAFYQSSELTERNAEQIKGWGMPLGRYSSSRQEWDKLFPQDWAAGIPEIINQNTTHSRLTVTGQNAIIFLRESEHPGEVYVACWAARSLSNPLLAAIRDHAFRDGYHTLISYVLETDLPLLGNDVQRTQEGQSFVQLPL